MEKDRDKIANLAHETGLTEQEARIFHLLSTATTEYGDLPSGPDKDVLRWSHHYRELVGMLSLRVVRRDHPEGWITKEEAEERRGRNESS